MRSALQMLGGVAVAGAVAAGSTAFTATGVTTTGAAALPQFVGGVVTQTVTGATLSNTAYVYTDATKTVVAKITLTFTAMADDHTVTVAPSGSGGAWSNAAADRFTCVGGTTASATAAPILAGETAVTCAANDGTTLTAAHGYRNMDTLTITVA